MVVDGLGDFGGRKDLVVVVVEDGEVVVGHGHEVVPVVERHECVVEDDTSRRRSGTDHVVTLIVVLFDLAHIQDGAKGFVDKLNCGDDVVIFVGAVLVCHVLQDTESDCGVVSVLPFPRVAKTGVVETVLGAGSAVQVDPDLEACVTGPADGSVEVLFLALNVGVLRKGGEGPVADWDTYVVEVIRFSDIDKVLLGEPRVPMGLKTGSSLLFA